MAVNNNLYPPIVDTYMPAFIIDSNQSSVCRIYFSISLYNNLKDIQQNAQVTVVNQYTNVNMLSENYPNGIMLTTVKEDNTKTTDDRFYIEIKSSDIDGGFVNDIYYKVQIRFTNNEIVPTPPKDPNTPGFADWLVEYLPYFSEWSTVCLIRGISRPILTISGLEDSSNITTWSMSNIDLSGRLTFEKDNEDETLKSYRVRLYSENEKLLQDSGTLYTNDYNNENELHHTIKYNLIEGEIYILQIDYTTRNLYEESKKYKFIVMQGSSDILDATLSSLIDEENGRIGIHIKSRENAETFIGNITIRRTSSETNFTIWEDVHTMSTEENKALDYTWWDCTVKSGVYYKYCAQRRSSTGNRGIIVNLKNPVMITFDHMYLTGHNTQLKIKFNPQIASFKRNILETKTDTIGSKYPFIKRNGSVDYRVFPISGTISYFMDEDHIFTSKEEIYKDTLELYKEYNNLNRNQISDFNDFTLERNFRERVSDFLYSNEVRLFRSASEGNILIKLMDINFTPNQTLGRMIYDFSATAYEIDEFTIENCDKYGIQSLGTYDRFLLNQADYFGVINENIPAGVDVLTLIEKKYQKYAKENYISKVDKIDYLKLSIESQPYLIKEVGNTPIPADMVMTRAIAAQDKNLYLGHIVSVNGIDIVINPEGVYTQKNEGTAITSLIFPVDTIINLDYHVFINQAEDTTKVANTISSFSRVGQYWGKFNYKDSVYKKIYTKYLEDYKEYTQRMLFLNDIQIEADEGTVVYIKEYNDKDFERHLIGPTCFLNFKDEENPIEGIYFVGMHFEPALQYEAARETLPEFKFVDSGETLDKVDKFFKPKYNYIYNLTENYIKSLPLNMVYGIDEISTKNIEKELPTRIQETNKKFKKKMKTETQSNRYIWHNDQWFKITDNNDVLCQVEAIINYYCDIAKGRFNVDEKNISLS